MKKKNTSTRKGVYNIINLANTSATPKQTPSRGSEEPVLHIYDTPCVRVYYSDIVFQTRTVIVHRCYGNAERQSIIQFFN